MTELDLSMFTGFARASAWDEAAELLQPSRDWLSDPRSWVAERLGEHLWSKQVQIMEAVRDHRHVAVPSCHESGKSFTAARAVAWWLDAHPPGTAFAVTTAPTGAQVRAILWREINRAHAKGGLFGRTNQTEWWLGKEMVAFGRKPSEYNTEAFQGIHAQYVLVVIDEANGVPKNLWDAAETLIANESGRMLAIGNPDDPSSYFAECCRPGTGWVTLPISAFDTPAFTGELVPAEVLANLIGPTWVEERRERWGETSPLYVSKVLGRFPEYSTDSIVPWSWVQECQLLGDELKPKPDAESVIGLDVGAGGDHTVAWHRYGRKATEKRTDHTADPASVVGLVMKFVRDKRATTVNVDTIGIGWGVAGFLEREIEEAKAAGTLTWDVDVVWVNVAESPSDREHYLNLRAEVWWEVGRENSRLHRWDLSKVDDDTVAQLIAPKYKIARNGLVQVESKVDLHKRIGRSPDDADALLLCFFDPPREFWGAA